MKKNSIFTITLLWSACALIFSSCKDDKTEDAAKPVIELNEVGMENSKTVTAGSDLHLQGKITAENLIKRIDIGIHREEGGSFEITKSFAINASMHLYSDILGMKSVTELTRNLPRASGVSKRIS